MDDVHVTTESTTLRSATSNNGTFFPNHQVYYRETRTLVSADGETERGLYPKYADMVSGLSSSYLGLSQSRGSILLDYSIHRSWN